MWMFTVGPAYVRHQTFAAGQGSTGGDIAGRITCAAMDAPSYGGARRFFFLPFCHFLIDFLSASLYSLPVPFPILSAHQLFFLPAIVAAEPVDPVLSAGSGALSL